MSNRYQAGILLPGYDALKVPNAPTIGTATNASATSVSVAFTAPSCVGGGAISSYQVFACCGARSAFGASSPLVVSGLTTGQAYTFKAVARNVYGPSYPSAASNSVTPVTIGQQAYTSSGTYSWVAPTGVTSVSVVAVGGGKDGPSGGGGGGGGLGYKNAYTVTPGNSYTVVVGSNTPGSVCSTNSYFVSTAVVKGGGGGCGNSSTGGTGGTYTGDGGGNGGAGGTPVNCSSTYGAGGGGAGGYSGAGGRGGNNNAAGASGSGGGGGGGAGAKPCVAGPGAGGGVGILGQGCSGSGGNVYPSTIGGRGGSGGGNAANSVAGLYGGGGSGENGLGKNGAVRIIWPGSTRSFPSTNTGDL